MPAGNSTRILSFNDEIVVGVARIQANELIAPSDPCCNDSDPVGVADFYLKRLYTLVCQRHSKLDTLTRRAHTLEQRILTQKTAKSRQQAIERFLVAASERDFAEEEVEALMRHFEVEAQRRIPILRRFKEHYLANDWCFYAEECVLDVPDDRLLEYVCEGPETIN